MTGVQPYPWSISIYKGEERFMIIPNIKHIGGYHTTADTFTLIDESENEISIKLGKEIFSGIQYVKDSPLSEKIPNKNPIWKKGSKYKGYITFWKHNYLTKVRLYEDGSYEVYSTEKCRIKKGGYNGCIKSIKLSANATAEDIGNAIIDVFKAAEEYYEQNPMNY